MVDLSIEFAGITFNNPFIVASSTPTKDAKSMKKAIDAGFGGVVAKTLCGNSSSFGRRYPRPRFMLFGWKDYPAYPKYKTRNFTLFSLEDNSPFNYEEYANDINLAKKLVGDKGVVIASIMGGNTEEWEELCDVINGTNADLCELNISCPYAADSGLQTGAGAVNITAEIVSLVRRKLATPFSVKVTPQTPSLADIARKAEQAGANAITVQGRLSGIMIDIETARPVGWGSIGGYGGPYLIGYGLKGVSEVALCVRIPISAVLGVWDWEDIIRYIMVGATTVQSATAVIMRGYNVVREWMRGIIDWMERKGYESIKDFKGIALKNIIRTRDVERAPNWVTVLADKNKCIGCGECLVSCFYDAITIKDGKALINGEKCDACGLCLEKCPVNAIKISRIK
ncbi:MAG: 4Fe-4S binding protein [Candidatus Bathyarchaeia archaeon]